MDSHKLVETGSVSEETKAADGNPGADCVKLVEMGDVSLETKGIIHGLELGLLPRSF